MSKLRDAGLKLDRKVEEYLQSGRRMKGSKHVNLNDDLAASERRGGHMERRAASRVRDTGLSPEVDAEAEAEGLSTRSKQQYAEFEALLAQREDRWPSPAEPKPPRDTKRSVGAQTLKNLQPDP